MLEITGTMLNVQSFMALSWPSDRSRQFDPARHLRRAFETSKNAAIRSHAAGASGRLRAILMTSRHDPGMTPMAIGFGEGGGQSAPLARASSAVIVSTFATEHSALDLRHPPAPCIDCFPISNPMDPTSRYYERDLKPASPAAILVILPSHKPGRRPVVSKSFRAPRTRPVSSGHSSAFPSTPECPATSRRSWSIAEAWSNRANSCPN
jgi:hypothetical protein